MLKDNGQIPFSKDFFSLSRRSIRSPLKIGEKITYIELEKQIKHSQKRKINKEECKCKEEGECSLQNETLEEEEIDKLKEEILNKVELGELERINSKINYLMINKEHIQNIIDRLEKLEIIGENVLKYWEKDKIQCILKIKNPKYKIKTTKIKTIDKDR